MKRGLETYFYSTLGIVAMLGILVAFNFIAARGKARIDLTEERAYTLSEGTRNILAKLDTPVQIRFYCSRNENRMPVMLKTYAQRVEDLLTARLFGTGQRQRDPNQAVSRGPTEKTARREADRQ